MIRLNFIQRYQDIVMKINGKQNLLIIFRKNLKRGCYTSLKGIEEEFVK